MMLKKDFGRASLKTSAIASNVAIVGVREALYTTGRSSKSQHQYFFNFGGDSADFAVRC
jgi:hypothetical protein